ncbi:unnamed protein product [Tenebrio molitor]|nr:unnamed protein product [Tenebrio molitor]
MEIIYIISTRILLSILGIFAFHLFFETLRTNPS